MEKKEISIPQTMFSKLRDSFFTKSHTFYPDSTSTESLLSMVDIVGIYDRRSNYEQEQKLYNRILEYKEMRDALPILDSIFTLYTDEVTTRNEFKGKTIWAENIDEGLSKETNDLIEFLEIEDNLPALTYNLVAFGNAYAEIVFTDKGVSRLVYHDVDKIKRVELPDGTLLGFAYVGNYSVSIDIGNFQKALIEKREFIKKN